MTVTGNESTTKSATSSSPPDVLLIAETGTVTTWRKECMEASRLPTRSALPCLECRLANAEAAWDVSRCELDLALLPSMESQRIWASGARGRSLPPTFDAWRTALDVR